MTSRPFSITSDPIAKLTWTIAIPASVGMLFNTAFNFIDTLCAGWLGTDSLAALSVSFALYFMLIAVGSGLSQGATALIANVLGANQSGEARRIFGQSLLFASVAGLLLSVIGLLAAPRIFILLGAEGNYLIETLHYMDVILIGGVFFILTMALNSALAAQGLTSIYRNFLITGCVANAALNPLLMWGLCGLPALGVAGIALATVLVQIGGCFYLWQSLKNGKGFEVPRLRDFAPDFKILGQIAAQSVPAALNMMTIAFGVFVITWFVKQFGKEAIAAVGIATRIEQMALLPVIGLGTAVLSIVGQNHGAGFHARVREAWRLNILWGVGLMCLGSFLVLLFGKDLMGLFTKDPEVIQNGVNYLFAEVFTLPAYPILFVTVFMMQGLKRPTYGLWMGLYRQILAPIFVMYLLVFSFHWGLWGVWWGFSLVTWSAALFALFWGWRAVKER
jgi:putative MATE family efflux protein